MIKFAAKDINTEREFFDSQAVPSYIYLARKCCLDQARLSILISQFPLYWSFLMIKCQDPVHGMNIMQYSWAFVQWLKPAKRYILRIYFKAYLALIHSILLNQLVSTRYNLTLSYSVGQNILVDPIRLRPLNLFPVNLMVNTGYLKLLLCFCDYIVINYQELVYLMYIHFIYRKMILKQ